MLEFKKLCDAFERLSSAERALLLAEKSVTVLARLHSLSVAHSDTSEILAGFVIGSAVSDGKLNEKEYLMIYPALVRVFGSGFDFNSVKASFCQSRGARRSIEEYTTAMLSLLGCLDEELKWEFIMLCLCIVSVDGKITPREKRYIRRLCEAEA